MGNPWNRWGSYADTAFPLSFSFYSLLHLEMNFASNELSSSVTCFLFSWCRHSFFRVGFSIKSWCIENCLSVRIRWMCHRRPWMCPVDRFNLNGHRVVAQAQGGMNERETILLLRHSKVSGIKIIQFSSCFSSNSYLMIFGDYE